MEVFLVASLNLVLELLQPAGQAENHQQGGIAPSYDDYFGPQNVPPFLCNRTSVRWRSDVGNETAAAAVAV